jgi:large subunit ribosomal protein L23
MPLFGFKKDKQHEQNHIQATAEMAKGTMPANRNAKNKVSRKPKTEKPAKVSKELVTKDAVSDKTVSALPVGSFSSTTDVIIRPRITEKSGILSQSGVYTFEVAKGANKQSIAKAVKALYKVTPVKIAVLNFPARLVFRRGKKGSVSGFRKAIVTVKKGDKIDFV